MNYSVSDEEKDETLFEQVGTCKESVMDQEDGGIDKRTGNQLRVGGETGIQDGLLVEETNKIDTSMVDDDQMDDPCEQGQASKEYLQFGGGFCLNEEDEDMKIKEPEECDVATSEEKSALVNDQSSGDDDPDPKAKFLRAMPNLRRKKKRKN